MVTATSSFLEMNTRLQVEHPVTEMITGLDLVELQLAVAGGAPLPEAALHPTITGHAIEVRLCAEDPYNGYLPSSGTFRRVDFPEIEGVRVDSGVASGSVVSPFYDSMIAKVIAHAPTRSGAINKLQRALGQAHLVGPITNRMQLLGLLPELADHWQQIDTGWLDGHPPTDPQIEPAFVAAAALAWARSQRTPLTRFPAGWRNNHSQLQQVRVGPHDVRYRYDRSGSVIEVLVDGEAVGGGWLPALTSSRQKSTAMWCLSRVANTGFRCRRATRRPTTLAAPDRQLRRCRDRSCGWSSRSVMWSLPANRYSRWRR